VSGTRTVEAMRPSRYSGVSHGCNEQLEELCRVRASPLDTNNPRWRGSHDSQMQSRNWRDVSCTLMAYASGNERSLVWREIDAIFESILTSVVINSNHVKS